MEKSDPLPTLLMDFPSLSYCYHHEVFLFPEEQIASSRKVSWKPQNKAVEGCFCICSPFNFLLKGPLMCSSQESEQFSMSF